MSIDTLTSHPEYMAAWAKSAPTKKFMEYLEEDRVVLIQRLRDEKDKDEMLRLQGELRRLDKILKLPAELERVVVAKHQK